MFASKIVSPEPTRSYLILNACMLYVRRLYTCEQVSFTHGFLQLCVVVFYTSARNRSSDETFASCHELVVNRFDVERRRTE